MPESDDLFKNDKLDREDQVRAVTGLLRNLDGPCVLAIDSAWGSGKTVFLKMLAQNMRNDGFHVAEFNAWETDFSTDPLIALFSALEPTLNMTPEDKGKTVMRAGAALVSKLASSSVPFMPDIASAVTDAGEQTQTTFKARLKAHRETVEAIQRFKDELESVKDDHFPVVICVDELDRCRPNYALEFLEIAKHIFDADGVSFILAVNMSELAHSVEALYGSNFDGRTYLRRFVDHVLYLPKPDRTRFVDHLLESVGLSHVTDPSRMIRAFFNDFVLETSDISLRDVEQAICHLGIALRTITPAQHEFGVPLESIITVLMVVRIVAPDTYHGFMQGEISDLKVVREANRRAGRSDDWWQPEQNLVYGLPRRIAIWEAIIAGCGRYLRGSTNTRSPLLEQRESESTGDGNSYPDVVIDEYGRVRDTDGWKYRRALALIEMWTFESEH